MAIPITVRMEFNISNDEVRMSFYNEQTDETIFSFDITADNVRAVKKYIDLATEMLESKDDTVEKEEE